MLNKIRQVSLIPELRFPSKRYAGFHYSGFMVYFAPVYSAGTPLSAGSCRRGCGPSRRAAESTAGTCGSLVGHKPAHFRVEFADGGPFRQGVAPFRVVFAAVFVVDVGRTPDRPHRYQPGEVGTSRNIVVPYCLGISLPKNSAKGNGLIKAVFVKFSKFLRIRS